VTNLSPLIFSIWQAVGVVPDYKRNQRGFTYLHKKTLARRGKRKGGGSKEEKKKAFM